MDTIDYNNYAAFLHPFISVFYPMSKFRFTILLSKYGSNWYSI